jgi:hypothetical protein
MPMMSVLSRLSSPRRGELLLERLKSEQPGYNSLYIEGLAASHCRAAIPAMEAIYKTRNDITSRLALNALGKPPLSLETEKTPDESPAARKGLRTEKGQLAMALLKAMLNQCDEFKADMKIQSVELNNSPILSINGSYPKQNLGWKFRVQELRDNRAIISFCRDGVGFQGRLEKLNGRWLTTRWRQEIIYD